MFFEIDQLINSFDLGDPERNKGIVKKLQKHGESITPYLYEKAIKAEDRFLTIQLLQAINVCTDYILKLKMLKAAERETDDFILATYLSLFRRLKLGDALPLVRKCMQTSDDARVKSNAFEFLAEFGEEEDLKYLRKFQDYPHNRVVVNALLAIALIGERIRDGAVQKLKFLQNCDDKSLSNSAQYAMQRLNATADMKYFGLNLSEILIHNY
ncbi:MAG: hypothetical protein PHW04_17040 [Candidatus Wallbacteria bacterium]|nr:hypothetical protein [Candidatus Wallbacteria bacterium]